MLIPSRIRKINDSSLNQFARWLNGPTRFTDGVEELACLVVLELVQPLFLGGRWHLVGLMANQTPWELREFLHRSIVGPGSYGSQIVLPILLQFENRCLDFPTVVKVNSDLPIKALASQA